jgi:hypothetical protein
MKPMEEQRRLVKSMAAMGIPHEGIARKLAIRSPKTLRKHFREELDMGVVEANFKVAQTLFQMAISGNCPAATMFWMKTRNRFRERPADEDRVALPPVIVAESKGPDHG